MIHWIWGLFQPYSRIKPTVLGISWHHVSKLCLDGELTSNLWPCWENDSKSWDGLGCIAQFSDKPVSSRFNFREHRGHRRSSVCWDGNKRKTTSKSLLEHFLQIMMTITKEFRRLWTYDFCCQHVLCQRLTIYFLIQQINMRLNILKLHIICMYKQHIIKT